MNQTLSTFLKFAVTAVAIGAFLFGIGYTMVDDEVTHYDSVVVGEQSDLVNN
jgi:hypothetical protein